MMMIVICWKFLESFNSDFTFKRFETFILEIFLHHHGKRFYIDNLICLIEDDQKDENENEITQEKMLISHEGVFHLDFMKMN